MRLFALALTFVTVLGSGAALRAQTIDIQFRIVGDPLGRAWVQLQGAVDAAGEGDVIHVRTENTYYMLGAVIDGKSLHIVALPGSHANFQAIEIRNLALGQEVVMSGISARGDNLYSSTNFTPGLTITNCQGNVRLENCSFLGGSFSADLGNFPGASGVRVDASERVAFVECNLTGGAGRNGCYWINVGTSGGSAFEGVNSSVVFYGCNFVGGLGGSGYTVVGNGGHAARLSSGRALFDGCTLTGASGGNACGNAAPGGNGGNGLEVDPNASATERGSTITGGPAGLGMGQSDGQPGADVVGALTSFAGAQRRFVAPLVSAPAQSNLCTIEGQPGERVFVLISPQPGFRFSAPNAPEAWCVPYPAKMKFQENGTIPAGGQLILPLHLPHNTGYVSAVYAQVYLVDPSGATALSNPRRILLVDGATVDCNQNGVSDLLDIGSKASWDFNLDFVPDDCQSNSSWYVDGTAPQGGDGSSAHPLRSIARGLSKCISGDTVIVRDGYYTGSENRNLWGHGATVHLTSENGPDNCRIECSGATSIVRSSWTDLPGTSIAGLTFENNTPGSTGLALNLLANAVRVSDCIFRGMTDVVTGFNASAVYLVPNIGESIVEDCVFADNRGGYGALKIGSGGAGAKTIVRRTLFQGNLDGSKNDTVVGGALYVLGGTSTVVSHCQFYDNRSDGYQYGGNWGGTFGGAVNFFGGGVLTIESSLFFNNHGPEAGAIAASLYEGTPPAISLEIRDSTFTQNDCSRPNGGGAILLDGAVRAAVANCILWGDLNGNGPSEITVDYTWARMWIRYSDVEGALPNIIHSPGTLIWEPGNIDRDPKFIDPDGPDDDPQTSEDNAYRLLGDSPCIDAGDNTAVLSDLADIDDDGDTNETVPLDINDKSRFKDIATVPDTGLGSAPIIDMGAYERQTP